MAERAGGGLEGAPQPLAGGAKELLRHPEELPAGRCAWRASCASCAHRRKTHACEIPRRRRAEMNSESSGTQMHRLATTSLTRLWPWLPRRLGRGSPNAPAPPWRSSSAHGPARRRGRGAARASGGGGPRPATAAAPVGMPQGLCRQRLAPIPRGRGKGEGVDPRGDHSVTPLFPQSTAPMDCGRPPPEIHRNETGAARPNCKPSIFRRKRRIFLTTQGSKMVKEWCF